MISTFLSSLFDFDKLAILMIALVLFIGVCVGSFAYRYMKGDARYCTFFIQLILLVFSVSVMASADNLVILFIAWCLNNILLVLLMVHKPSWKAARMSGILAAKNYLIGGVSIGCAFVLFYWVTDELSIQALVHQDNQSILMVPALLLLLIGAMTQSAIWPFCGWLRSSLNSPTPVSAIMHAGLVNGGGFLLIRFAPLYLDHSYLLTLLFVVGVITALLGTLWKLIQSDVKRMLACSTIGQMGFMLAQCGMGLFAAAVAHLIWHGMFKAYLFLASGSAGQEKRSELGYPVRMFAFLGSLVCGVAGSLGFAFANNLLFVASDTTAVLIWLSFIAASQFALPMLREKTLRHLPLSFVFTALIGFAYGCNVKVIALILGPTQLMQPQTLNAFHITGIIVMTLAWLFVLFVPRSGKIAAIQAWILRNYVMVLNASQPHPDTVTVYRKQYQYL